MYGGQKMANSISGPTVSGGQTLTVALDLTPAGGYNGVNKFGRVIWMTNGVAMGSFTCTSDRSWGSLLVSQGGSTSGVDRCQHDPLRHHPLAHGKCPASPSLANGYQYLLMNRRTLIRCLSLTPLAADPKINILTNPTREN